MSELKVDKVSPRSGNYVSLNTVGSKNIIINGDMSIAQRGTSNSGITSGDTYRNIDRFAFSVNSVGTWTLSQDTTVPTGQGFAKSCKFDCTTANGSLSAGSYLILLQKIEGQNLQYLAKGTSSAKSTTLSFWVRSNKTGTYICELNDNDNTRSISKSYTINSADTWEKKTITFAGDTSGTLGNDNAHSLDIRWWLAAGTTYTSGTLNTSWNSSTNANRAVGQVNLADDTANEWYVTGVQLEAGTTASDFEFLPVDMNLQRCQRYYQKSYNQGVAPETITNTSREVFEASGTVLTTTVKFVTEMRASPTVSVFSPADGTSGIDISGSNSVSATVADAGTNSFRVAKGATPGLLSFHYTANGEL